MDFNSFHPERVVFMRKEILLPAVAVAGGGAGFVLRRWELATAFEADTGLPIPGAPATLALIALSVAMAAVLALLCRGKYPSFTGYDEAFQAKGNTLYATAMVLSAFLLLGAAVLMVLSFVQGTNTVYTRLLLAALAAVSFFYVMQTAQNSFKGLDRGKYSFTLLMPAYTCCVWLIAAYQVRAGDPVQLDYVYELFAIIASLLGLYFHAGFSFERGRVFWAGLFSLLGIYFCLTTLADQHDLATTLLYGFAILYLLSSTVTLLYNAGRPELLARAENDTTEGTPDES